MVTTERRSLEQTMRRTTNAPELSEQPQHRVITEGAGVLRPGAFASAGLELDNAR
jgi:hypothetical protein